MHRSFQQWSEDFSVNEDLHHLEQDLTMGDFSVPHSPVHHVAESVPQVDRLAYSLSERLMALLSDDDFLDQFLHARELRKDNQLLAAQVQHLLKEKKRLEELAELAEKKARQFKNIAGNLYLKID